MHSSARRLLVTALAAGAAVTMTPTAAHATIHEIVAQYCSGRPTLEPPGLEDGKNFAQPVNVNGFVAGPPVPFRDGLVLDFDFDTPSSKVVPTGEYRIIARTPAGPLYLPLFEPDPNFPAFQRCPAMAP